MKKEMSTHAKAAKSIRNDLKKEFPLIKFQVRSETFSGGDSVGVEWINGPNYDQVNKIIKKYEYGHFDAMFDSYEYSNSRKDIPQVKYVQTERKISDEIYEEIFQEFKKKCNGLDKLTSFKEMPQELMNHWGTYIWRIVCKMDLTNGYQNEEG